MREARAVKNLENKNTSEQFSTYTSYIFILRLLEFQKKYQATNGLCP